MHDLYREARYLVETDVLPSLTSLKRRLEIERGKFWRKLLLKGMTELPSLALKWMSTGGVVAAVDAAKLAGGAASQAIDNERLVQELFAHGGLGYLVSAQAEFQRSVSID